MMPTSRLLQAVFALLTTGAGAFAADAPTQPNTPAAPVAPAAPVQTPPATAAVRETLTTGVTAIASAGVPGPLAVWGDAAWPIVIGRHDGGTSLPVVVAAQWPGPAAEALPVSRGGRILAFGHGGMVGSDALKHEGTARLITNAVPWLMRSRLDRRANRIGVDDNAAMVELLKGAGFPAEAMPKAWPDDISSFDLIFVDAHDVNAKRREQLRPYLAGGGGLITGGLGWGWLQLNDGKTIHQHPGNLLLREAGIAWCDGTLDARDDKTFAVGAVPETLHAAAAMKSLQAAAEKGLKGKVDPQVSATLTAALRVIPQADPIAQRADELLAKHGKDLAPGRDGPMRVAMGVARVLMAVQVERLRDVPASETHAHATASDFPGAVPADAPRISRDLTLTIPDAEAWISTGLYAPPGEVITITAKGLPKGTDVQIGCHTDHLWHLDAWRRVPEIVRRWPIPVAIGKEKAAGEATLTVANPFGGLIYIAVPNGRDRAAATVSIRGGIESPRFVLGQTTSEQWLKVRTAAAPWCELESGKVIVTVPSEHVRMLDDPTGVLQFWDRISDAHATLATIPLQPKRPHRYVADVQISAGYMHSGYPIMTHLDAADEMVSLAKLKAGSWGLLHELGHNHQVSDWTFDGTGEVTVNLFSLHAIDTICTPPAGSRGHPGVDNPPSLAEHLAKEPKARFEAWKRDPFLALHMYVQLQKAFGWETYKKVFAEYRALPRAERPKGEEQERDQWMVRFSRACGKNLGPFFVAWGVPTTEAARASIADLPAWMPEDWPTAKQP